MAERPDALPAAAFPIRAGVRIAVALSVVLALVGGVGFLGLLRMSALKVHKAITVFGESTVSPNGASPLALAVRSIESGRLESPGEAGQVSVGNVPLSRTTSTSQSLLFSVPPGSEGESRRLIASAKALDLEALPIGFEIGTARGAAGATDGIHLEGVGTRIRTAAAESDEVPAPAVTLNTPGCEDVVTVIPAGGVAQRFLATELLVRVTTQDGAPRSNLRVELQSSYLGAPPNTVAKAATDLFGLAELSALLDADASYSLRWDCDGGFASASVALPLQNDGVLADWQPEPLDARGHLRIAMIQNRQRATWQADLFCGDRWLQSEVLEQIGGEGTALVSSVSEEAMALPCKWQASGQPYLPHPIHAGIWILPASSAADLRAAALRLFDRMAIAAQPNISAQLRAPSRARLAASDDRQVASATRWLLSWLPRSFAQRPVLADSAARDLRELERYKRLWRLRFQLMLGLAGAGLVALWLPRAVRGLLKDSETLEVATREVSEPEDVTPVVTRFWLSVAGLVLVVVLAVAATIAMVWVVS